MLEYDANSDEGGKSPSKKPNFLQQAVDKLDDSKGKKNTY